MRIDAVVTKVEKPAATPIISKTPSSIVIVTESLIYLIGLVAAIISFPQHREGASRGCAVDWRGSGEPIRPSPTFVCWTGI